MNEPESPFVVGPPKTASTGPAAGALATAVDEAPLRRSSKSSMFRRKAVARKPLPAAERWILGLVTMTVLMVSVSSFVLQIALPTVLRHFHSSTLASTWVLLTPSLISTCLLVTCGRVADMFGRRHMFLLGLAVYTGSAVLLGFAPSVWALIGLEAVQAVGAAMLLCNTGAIVASMFNGARLNYAMGVYLAGVSVAQLVGPSLGGFIAEGIGWRWIFWTQVPLGLICLGLGFVHLRRLPPRIERTRAMDYLGAALMSGALLSLLIGMSSVQSNGLVSWQVGAGIAGALALFPLVYVAERRAADPVLPLHLFGNRQFLLANLSGFLNVMPRFTSAVLVGLYFQSVSGDSAMEAGLKIVPLPIGVTLASILTDRIARSLGQRHSATIGSVVMVAGLISLLLSLTGQWSYPSIAVALFVLGVGVGVFSTINSSMIFGESPDHETGAVNGVRLTVMNVGGSIATAGGLAIATSSLPIDLRSKFYQATLKEHQYLDLLHIGFVWAFVVMVAAVMVSGMFTLLIRARPTAAQQPRKADGPPCTAPAAGSPG
ncbi:MFS transporter [Dactylosporangium sp. CA-233914]|uniref:MFS transporter n=1 Tax=Dactylosporangium sp. CA-233914 TaxID=3239934 RepID=UPI003D8BC26A